MTQGSNASSFSLAGRVVLITGGAGLLGEHFARAVSEAGAHAVLADVDDRTCVARAAELSKSGPKALGVACDVSDADSLARALGTALKEFGRMDGLVNGAGVTNSSRSANYGAVFEDFPRADWDRVLAVNLTGVMLGCQIFGRHMLAQGSGAIVNIGSMYGVMSPTHPMYDGSGVLQPAAYSASKAGVIALTRYLGTLWAPRGVRVNALSPGGVFSGQSEVFLERFGARNPTKRMAQPTEMRGALVYLLSDASSYCIGHNLVVDGGWTAW
jgi:NAD(P)-dependent dehydrogenase (short-subunit alcohol dehydrogenase family)